ncbi:MAG: SH3 domain-containing protein [Pseudomonadota bacterium]
MFQRAGDIDGATLGSSLSGQLTGSDRKALEAALSDALLTDQEKVDWAGDTARGRIIPAGRFLSGVQGNLGGDFLTDDTATNGQSAPTDVPPNLYLGEPLETDLGLHALKRNSNVRVGPSTDYKILETLPSGTAVTALGKVSGKPWMLVATSGKVRGYVHANLMAKQPGTELELAGGPTRRVYLCREFEQRMIVNGQRDGWNGVACKRGERWVVERPPANQPTRLY